MPGGLDEHSINGKLPGNSIGCRTRRAGESNPALQDSQTSSFLTEPKRIPDSVILELILHKRLEWSLHGLPPFLDRISGCFAINLYLFTFSRGSVALNDLHEFMVA